MENYNWKKLAMLKKRWIFKLKCVFGLGCLLLDIARIGL
jgi:hypothetical protein